MPLLEVKNLTVKFDTREGTITAVDNISFSIKAGETLGIVGESGSGKSVSCYALLGLIPMPPGRIETGSALYAGTDLLSMSKKQLRSVRGAKISMIFQEPMTSLNPYLTVGAQLIEPLMLHLNTPKKAAYKQAVEALIEVGIEDAEKRIHCYPFEFSGGMRQRVMIAMALINKPDLLIADEPTTALDVTVQAQILELIKKLQREHNLAVIFISHDLGVVAKMADHVLVMEKGKMVEYGKAQQVLHNPEQPYTQKLLGSIPRSAKPYEKQHQENAANFLEVKNLHTEFNTYTGLIRKRLSSSVKAVNNISLSIKQGEILGLVGESGSGKSTLGRSIMRLVEPSAGSVFLDGTNLTALSGKALQAARPDFQMIFQDPYASLNPRMTVFNILAEPIKQHRLTKPPELLALVNELMDDVGLSRHMIRKYPHEFSGGQRQRIAIARALAMKPKFIVADEPVSALDVTIQAQILELLMALTKKYKLCMLFISHDLAVIRYISDNVAVMRHGEIVETGDTETLFNNPKHSYTQSLLASILQL